MFKSKIVEILSNTQVFQAMSRKELKIISKHCQKIGFKRGDVLIGIDENPPGFFILIHGRLRVMLPQQMTGRKGRRASAINLNVLHEGDCFGEYSLIEKTRTTASVVAEEPGEVLKIPAPDFEKIMADDRLAKIVYHNILHILIKRLRKKESELDLVLLAS
jgi:CRP-like cAMP-binding protein